MDAEWIFFATRPSHGKSPYDGVGGFRWGDYNQVLTEQSKKQIFTNIAYMLSEILTKF